MSHSKEYADEKYLMSGLQQSDMRAYSIIFKKYYPVLCAYACRFLSLEESEDIVQDVFFNLWLSRKETRIQKSLGAYLFKSVYNRALNRLANTKQKDKLIKILSKNPSEIFQNADFYQITELQSVIRKAINELPESYRDAFIKQRFNGMTYREIAEEEGVSTKTIDYRIQQALKELRIKLKDFLPILIFLDII